MALLKIQRNIAQCWRNKYIYEIKEEHQGEFSSTVGAYSTSLSPRTCLADLKFLGDLSESAVAKKPGSIIIVLRKKIVEYEINQMFFFE